MRFINIYILYIYGGSWNSYIIHMYQKSKGDGQRLMRSRLILREMQRQYFVQLAAAAAAPPPPPFPSSWSSVIYYCLWIWYLSGQHVSSMGHLPVMLSNVDALSASNIPIYLLFVLIRSNPCHPHPPPPYRYELVINNSLLLISHMHDAFINKEEQSVCAWYNYFQLILSN